MARSNQRGNKASAPVVFAQEMAMTKVRLGLVGCGVFGESHLQAFRAIRTGEIVAVFDIDRGRARRLADAFGGPRVCDSLQEICTLPDLQAIDVVTPEAAHLQPVLAALAAGRHVFVEKPMAGSLDQCTQMIQAAQNARRSLMVGHIVRYETKYAMLKEEVASGRLGKVVSLYARRNRQKTLLARQTLPPPVIETGIHDIDLMLWYAGAPVRRVRGYERRATQGTHHDTFWGVLEFEGGAIGIVETVWLIPPETGILMDDQFQVIGDRGIGTVQFIPGGLTFWRDSGTDVPDTSYDARVFQSAHGALRDELAYFCECVQEDRTPAVIAPIEAKRALRVALALLESANAQRDVEITEWD
jgi:predicted dehydrogenase